MKWCLNQCVCAIKDHWSNTTSVTASTSCIQSKTAFQWGAVVRKAKSSTTVRVRLFTWSIHIIWNQVLNHSRPRDGPSQSCFAPIIQTQRHSVEIYVWHQHLSHAKLNPENVWHFLGLEEAHFSPNHMTSEQNQHDASKKNILKKKNKRPHVVNFICKHQTRKQEFHYKCCSCGNRCLLVGGNVKRWDQLMALLRIEL